MRDGAGGLSPRLHQLVLSPRQTSGWVGPQANTVPAWVFTSTEGADNCKEHLGLHEVDSQCPFLFFFSFQILPDRTKSYCVCTADQRAVDMQEKGA